MTQWRMMSDFSITLTNRPGALARLAAQLREADVNLLGLWGYGESADGPQQQARFYCVPENPEQFRNFAESAVLDVEEGATFFISGQDHVGALVKQLERIANAGVNLRAIKAISVEAGFGCFIWADAGDWPRLVEVLESGS